MFSEEQARTELGKVANAEKAFLQSFQKAEKDLDVYINTFLDEYAKQDTKRGAQGIMKKMERVTDLMAEATRHIRVIQQEGRELAKAGMDY